MVTSEIVDFLRKYSDFFNSHFHGYYHWKTVERNGLYLSQFNNADKSVVSYFAHFHDCMRQNEGHDPEHGPRAVSFLKKHRELIQLDDQQFDTLCFACSGHTFGRKTDDSTIATCWDADRLDLERVGIVRDADYFFTEKAIEIVKDNNNSPLYEFGGVKI